MSMEDLIAEEDVVVTITRGGYAKRTKADLYRSQRRGGKGVRGAQLREDDIVEHFFVTTTHDWILFFTNMGRVYRAKAYELPDAGPRRPRPARREPARVPARGADRPGARPARLRAVAVPRARHARTAWSRRPGSTEYDTNRSGGVIAINLREGDELIAARLVDDGPTTCCWSAARASRSASPRRRRRCGPMGRATSGVIGMRFRAGDELLAMDVVRPDADLRHRHRRRLRASAPR